MSSWSVVAWRAALLRLSLLRGRWWLLRLPAVDCEARRDVAAAEAERGDRPRRRADLQLSVVVTHKNWTSTAKTRKKQVAYRYLLTKDTLHIAQAP